MNIDTTILNMRNATEDFLKNHIESIESEPFRNMLRYHMGWYGEGSGEKAQGKRLRPLFVLVCCSGLKDDWQMALPLAGAVELIHNFSLIHDDIEDQSDLRHGRKTLWNLEGTAQAINAGDLMFNLAFGAILSPKAVLSADQKLSALWLLENTCRQLTTGQYLDMKFEHLDQISQTEYFQMISGKTAALLSACAKLGGIAAEASSDTLEGLENYGLHLGLAFQMVDDILGIWGDAAITGKPNYSDLLTKKKTLPVILGLDQSAVFSALWNNGKIDQVSDMARALEDCGAKAITQQLAETHTLKAIKALKSTALKPDQQEWLINITQSLTYRNQ